jgi:hypothetical protein
MALCPLYGSCPLYISLSFLRPSVASTALCSLYCPLSPLRPSAPSTALCSLYVPLSSLWPSVPQQPSVPQWSSVFSMALCLLYSHLSPSNALCLRNGPCPPLAILCTLYGPLPPLRPSIPSMTLYSSTAFCPFYVSLSLLQPFSILPL